MTHAAKTSAVNADEFGELKNLGRGECLNSSKLHRRPAPTITNSK